MSLEQSIADLSLAATELLEAVNVSKESLDTAVASAAADRVQTGLDRISTEEDAAAAALAASSATTVAQDAQTAMTNFSLTTTALLEGAAISQAALNEIVVDTGEVRDLAAAAILEATNLRDEYIIIKDDALAAVADMGERATLWGTKLTTGPVPPPNPLDGDIWLEFT